MSATGPIADARARSAKSSERAAAAREKVKLQAAGDARRQATARRQAADAALEVAAVEQSAAVRAEDEAFSRVGDASGKGRDQ